MINALEIDILKVGENKKSGDAIAMRFGNYESGSWKSQYVVIVDGGDISGGERLMGHIQDVYKTDKVDRVILTHPDGDHASGLRGILKEMQVGKIWMHRPWNHWKELLPFCHDGRITTTSFGERLRKAYDFADQIENLAIEKKIPILAPHQGSSLSVENEKLITILGPGKDYYLSLVEESDKTPRMLTESYAKTFSAEKVRKYEDMTFETENLSAESGSTSAENNMSLVLYLTIAGKKILLSADSGCDGLYKSIRYAKENNFDLKNLDMMTVPHHGSRHNLSQGILSEIYAKIGIISCAAQGAPKHPSPIVINSLLRRNIKPFLTQGRSLHYKTANIPTRQGNSSSKPAEFANYVDV